MGMFDIFKKKKPAPKPKKLTAKEQAEKDVKPYV